MSAYSLGSKRHEKTVCQRCCWSSPAFALGASDLAKNQPCHFCLEATGPYSQEVALFLVEKEQKVSVINPARIRFFGLAQNQGNKTDKADARLIAHYCQLQSPPPWRVAAAEVRLLQEMVRRLHALSDLAAQEKNRSQAPGQGKAVAASSKRMVAALEKELLRLEARSARSCQSSRGVTARRQTVAKHAGHRRDHLMGRSGRDARCDEFDSAQSAAAYAGLAPREQRSGTSVRKATTLSKRGNRRLRKAFYFPAVTAMQWNPLVKAHYERMREKGKPKMVALAACMRKMLMICYGVLKHQKPFDPSWSNEPCIKRQKQAQKNAKGHPLTTQSLVLPRLVIYGRLYWLASAYSSSSILSLTQCSGFALYFFEAKFSVSSRVEKV